MGKKKQSRTTKSGLVKNRLFYKKHRRPDRRKYKKKEHVKKTYTVHIKVSIINKSSQRNHFSKMFLFLQSRLKNIYIYILITISGD